MQAGWHSVVRGEVRFLDEGTIALVTLERAQLRPSNRA
jgi:hypothetical protein